MNEGLEKTSNSPSCDLVFQDKMFFVAAHELKSPLALIRQLSMTIEQDDCDKEYVKRLAHQVTLTSERALRLTSSLTYSSRLDDTIFELEPINPLSICYEIVSELEPLYKAKGREIKIGTRNCSFLGLANRDLLRRIMLNFCDNALNYANSNIPVVIKAAVMNCGKNIRLSVRDYGPSISRKKYRKIVSNLGIRAQQMSNRPESSGLGLYISGKFADIMGAKIGIIRHNDGVTFYVDIPVSIQLSLL